MQRRLRTTTPFAAQDRDLAERPFSAGGNSNALQQHRLTSGLQFVPPDQTQT
jgi:hypothetical protein